MQFGRRKDGRFYPKSSRRSITVRGNPGMSLEAYRGLHRHETTRRQRIFTRAERARLSTLENPLLYSNFVKKLEKLNPDIFDPDWIDRTLEPEEALLDLKRKHPELDIGLKEKEQIEGFREFLDEIGITNERLQNMIAMEDSPLSEDELNQLAYILQMRSEHAQKTDMALKAPLAKDVRTWIANPNRVDIKTVDQ